MPKKAYYITINSLKKEMQEEAVLNHAERYKYIIECLSKIKNLKDTDKIDILELFNDREMNLRRDFFWCLNAVIDGYNLECYYDRLRLMYCKIAGNGIFWLDYIDPANCCYKEATDIARKYVKEEISEKELKKHYILANEAFKKAQDIYFKVKNDYENCLGKKQYILNFKNRNKMDIAGAVAWGARICAEIVNEKPYVGIPEFTEALYERISLIAKINPLEKIKEHKKIFLEYFGNNNGC